MTTPSVSRWRDNLNIGLFLAPLPYGALKEDILVNALGYQPGATGVQGDYSHYERRLRAAYDLGQDGYASRTPGYFTFNAQPFGQLWVYKVVWYVWKNPASDIPQPVLIVATDIEPMRRRRERDLDTREKRTRNIRAADNIQAERRAIQGQDIAALQATHERMLLDESIGDIITGLVGLPYVNFENILEMLVPGNPYNRLQFDFVKTAQRLRRLERDAKDEKRKALTQLSNWLTVSTGLPTNARQLALQDAQRRLHSI